MRHSLEPETPAEFQALAILVSAAHLAEEIDVLRQQLAVPTTSSHHKPILASRLLEAAERLINLLTLLQRRSHEYGSDFATHMDNQVAKLRQHILGNTRELVIDRARGISRKAGAVLNGSTGYPLGLAGKLREMFTGVAVAVEALGGLDVFSAEEQGVIAGANDTLALLAARESILELEAVA